VEGSWSRLLARRAVEPAQNGELYLEFLTVSAVRDPSGATTHYVGVFSDITKAKESQEKLDHWRTTIR
jgi:hypothetical protein